MARPSKREIKCMLEKKKRHHLLGRLSISIGDLYNFSNKKVGHKKEQQEGILCFKNNETIGTWPEEGDI